MISLELTVLPCFYEKKVLHASSLFYLCNTTVLSNKYGGSLLFLKLDLGFSTIQLNLLIKLMSSDSWLIMLV